MKSLYIDFSLTPVYSTIGAEVGRERQKVLSFPFYRWGKKALMKLNNWLKAKKWRKCRLGFEAWQYDPGIDPPTCCFILPSVKLSCPTWAGPSLPCDSCLQWMRLHSSSLLCTLHNTHSFLTPFCYLTIFLPINMQPKVSPLSEAFLLCFSKK